MKCSPTKTEQEEREHTLVLKYILKKACLDFEQLESSIVSRVKVELFDFETGEDVIINQGE